MVKRISVWLFTVVVLTALSVGEIPQVVNASHAWGNYHWSRSKNPIYVDIHSNVSAAWKKYFTTAVSDWNKSSVVKLRVVNASNNKGCTPKTNRIEVCNKKYGLTGWLGLASISFYTASGHIITATAKMNDSYTMNTSEKQLVMCQEIGHDIGLDHQDENNNNTPKKTCMDYTSAATASQNMHPNKHDYAQLNTIYKHKDAASTSEFIGNMILPAMLTASLDLPSQWGRLLKSGNDGLTETYELDLGEFRIVTFVIWARD